MRHDTRPSGHTAPLPRRGQRDMPAVYFIQAETGGPIKIGSAWDPKVRLRGLQTGNPERLRIIGVIYDQHETYFHHRFAHLRMVGEWFRAEPELLEYLRRWDDS